MAIERITLYGDREFKHYVTEIHNWNNNLLSGDLNGCSKLSSVTFRSDLDHIGEGYFKNCPLLGDTETIPGVKLLNGWIVDYDANVEEINITDSEYDGIAAGAFKDCENLISITIPDSVKSIGSYAFSSCRGLTSVTIPDSVTSIGQRVFYYCTSLTSVSIPDSVMSIGQQIFYCSGLKSVTIGNGITAIETGTFMHCNNLSSVIIGNSVTNILAAAFFDCSNLTELFIPDSVINIGYYVFNNTAMEHISLPNYFRDKIPGDRWGLPGNCIIEIREE